MRAGISGDVLTKRGGQRNGDERLCVSNKVYEGLKKPFYLQCLLLGTTPSIKQLSTRGYTQSLSHKAPISSADGITDMETLVTE